MPDPAVTFSFVILWLLVGLGIYGISPTLAIGYLLLTIAIGLHLAGYFGDPAKAAEPFEKPFSSTDAAAVPANQPTTASDASATCGVALLIVFGFFFACFTVCAVTIGRP